MPGEVKHWVCSDCVQRWAYKGHMVGSTEQLREVNCGDCLRELKPLLEARKLEIEKSNLQRIAVEQKRDQKRKQMITLQNEIYKLRSALRAKQRASSRAQHSPTVVGTRCPRCKLGQLVERASHSGPFLSCTREPDCGHTQPFRKGYAE